MENKPRLCDILGVPPGQPFYVASDRFENGNPYYDGPYIISDDADTVTTYKTPGRVSDIDSGALCFAINHPESVVMAAAPDLDARWALNALQKCFGVRYISLSYDAAILWLWRERPEFNDIAGEYDGDEIGVLDIPKDFLPHLHPGDLVSLEDTRRCDKIETHNIAEQEEYDEEPV